MQTHIAATSPIYIYIERERERSYIYIYIYIIPEKNPKHEFEVLGVLLFEPLYLTCLIIHLDLDVVNVTS